MINKKVRECARTVTLCIYFPVCLFLYRQKRN